MEQAQLTSCGPETAAGEEAERCPHSREATRAEQRSPGPRQEPKSRQLPTALLRAPPPCTPPPSAVSAPGRQSHHRCPGPPASSGTPDPHPSGKGLPAQGRGPLLCPQGAKAQIPASTHTLTLTSTQDGHPGRQNPGNWPQGCGLAAGGDRPNHLGWRVPMAPPTRPPCPSRSCSLTPQRSLTRAQAALRGPATAPEQGLSRAIATSAQHTFTHGTEVVHPTAQRGSGVSRAADGQPCHQLLRARWALLKQAGEGLAEGVHSRPETKPPP